MQIKNPILRLALPSVLTNITVPLLGLVDISIVGRMERPECMAAVAIGTTVFNMTYWLFAFLRMGTTGIVSQAYGAGNRDSVRSGLVHGIAIGIVIALLLLLLQTPLLKVVFWLMAPEPAVCELAEAYYRVGIFGAPAALVSYVLTGWFIGIQDTRTPMFMAILQNLLNILSTVVFVYLFGMGVSGVALGTVVGLYGGVWAAPFLSPRLLGVFEEGKLTVGLPAVLRSSLRSLWQSREGTICRDLFLRTLCLVAVTVCFTTAGSRMGAICLDANALLMQFFIVYSYFTDGLANAAEALSGAHVGARDAMGLRHTVRQLFRMGFFLALFFTLLYGMAGSWILGLLTTQAEVLAAARPFLPWVVAVPFVALPAFIWDGIYIGMTATHRMFLSMLVAAIVFFVLLLMLPARWGNDALWFAFLAYLATRSLMQTVLNPTAKGKL